jgi:NAD(P)-dependent dehydrogenase (short-subunit alcohol dehydrogenase family)
VSAWSRALVTGASSGIGRALAIELARTGCEVFAAARRRRALAEVVAAIEGEGGRAHALTLDVGNTDATVAAIRTVDRETGGFDLIVASAGVGPPRGAPAFSWEALQDPCHVNFCGAAATLTAVLPRMVERRRGHLVGIGSLSAFGALPGSGAYCAPKAGLAMLLDCLRLDVAKHGVAVTNVFLGFVDTPMVAHRNEAMPQLMQADDVARRLLRSLPGRPRTVAIPQPLAAATRLAGVIPLSLRDRLLARLR